MIQGPGFFSNKTRVKSTSLTRIRDFVSLSQYVFIKIRALIQKPQGLATPLVYFFRDEFAKLFWEKGDEAVSTALVATQILRSKADAINNKNFDRAEDIRKQAL